MTLEEYFDATRGLWVLSTDDSNGKLDAALYVRPHFMSDGTKIDKSRKHPSVVGKARNKPKRIFVLSIFRLPS